MTRFKCMVSWSSGKDSAWMVHVLRQRPDIELAGGLRARLTCVNPKVVDAGFAGREFDAALLDELPASVDPCGERGEFHSFAYAGPMFSGPIAIVSGEIVERDGFVFQDLVIG